MREWITGRNAVFEVLQARRRQVFRLWVAQGVHEKGRVADILRLCEKKNVPVEWVDRNQLNTLDSDHQGVALEVSGYPYSTLVDILAISQQHQEAPLVLILDMVQDPQNLGALLRTAEAVGVHGVLLPLRRTATVTPTVVKVSSGASEHLLICQVNLAQGIERLKAAGVWIIGLENTAEAYLPHQVRLDGPLAIVVGSEGQGMRPLVRASCDWMLRLPMRGKVTSLNAAVAGSIALYLAWQARGFDLQIRDNPSQEVDEPNSA